MADGRWRAHKDGKSAILEGFRYDYDDQSVTVSMPAERGGHTVLSYKDYGNRLVPVKVRTEDGWVAVKPSTFAWIRCDAPKPLGVIQRVWRERYT